MALSTQTGALYFLHPMDPGKYMSYYETVAEPLAFAQVARRLRVAAAAAAASSSSSSSSAKGAAATPPVVFEDAVQEFATGVRHVFLNAAGYNPPLTSPWLAGRKLSAVFERLLLDWVLDPKVGLVRFEVCVVCPYQARPRDPVFYFLSALEGLRSRHDAPPFLGLVPPSLNLASIVFFSPPLVLFLPALVPCFD